MTDEKHDDCELGNADCGFKSGNKNGHAEGKFIAFWRTVFGKIAFWRRWRRRRPGFWERFFLQHGYQGGPDAVTPFAPDPITGPGRSATREDMNFCPYCGAPYKKIRQLALNISAAVGFEAKFPPENICFHCLMDLARLALDGRKLFDDF